MIRTYTVELPAVILMQVRATDDEMAVGEALRLRRACHSSDVELAPRQLPVHAVARFEGLGARIVSSEAAE